MTLGISPPQLKEDGSNFFLFKQRLADLIIGSEKGLRRHLIGISKKPAPPQDISDPRSLDEYEDQLDEYERKESLVRSLIMSNIPESVHIRLLGTQSAHEMWTKLCSFYEKPPPSTRRQIAEEVFSVGCPNNGNPMKAFDKFIYNVHQHHAIGGIQLSADILINYLLKGMPTEAVDDIRHYQSITIGRGADSADINELYKYVQAGIRSRKWEEEKRKREYVW